MDKIKFLRHRSAIERAFVAADMDHNGWVFKDEFTEALTHVFFFHRIHHVRTNHLTVWPRYLFSTILLVY